MMKQAPCFTVGCWLVLGCMFGCARSSTINKEAWPRSLVRVYILVCCNWLVELWCTHWFVFSLVVPLTCLPQPCARDQSVPWSSRGQQQLLQHTRGMSHGIQALHLRRRSGHHAHTVNHSMKSSWESPCQDTRVECALAESVDEVGEP